MRSLRSQLILSHLLPLLLILPLITIVLLYLVESQVLLASLSQRAAEQAALLAQVLRRQANVLESPEQAQAFVAALTQDGLVVLLDRQGQLLAAAGQDGQAGSSQVSQAGVATALRGQNSVLVAYGLGEQRAEVLAPITDASGRVVGVVGVTRTLSGLSSLLGRLRQLVGWALLLELAAGAALGVLLARRLARPIVASTQAVVDLAEGRAAQTVAVAGPDELRQLAGAANALAERLRLLEETRRRSLANVVHEIGRPLGAMRSAVHVLRGPAGDDAAIRAELLGGVEAQIVGMQPLLDDLAQLHGQVSGRVDLMRWPMALAEWLPSVLLPWRTAALDKGLDWQDSLPDELPTVAIDPDKLAQAVGNLLSNAIKYTPAGGSVAVAAGVQGREVWLQVADSGPGIAADEHSWVFEPFYRSERERRFPQGLGLGLTIARELIQAHSGRLELDSQPGKGSRFTVYLPLSPDVSE